MISFRSLAVFKSLFLCFVISTFLDLAANERASAVNDLVGKQMLTAAKTWSDVRNLPCREPVYWDEERRLNRLIDPSFAVEAAVGNQSLLVPWAYVRPPAWALNCKRRPGLSFAFWIPDLGPLEADYVAMSRPEQTREPPRRANEEVVEVFSVKPYFEDGNGGSRSMARWIIEDMNPPRESNQLTTQYGLWRTAPDKGTLATVLWFRNDTRERIAMECSKAIPRCETNADFKDMGLSVVLIFDKGAIVYNDVIIRGVRTLLERWRTAANSEYRLGAP